MLISYGFQFKKEVSSLEKFQRRAKTMIKEMENISYNGRTKECNVYIL